ncbi:hypothetical protein SAMN06309944_1328 [Micrococcales bacterium KH10]|nr:hypothetical protein SAMN06309944_1328 [Micrococcales bacterium KH10]
MQRDRWRLAPFLHEAARNVFDFRAKLFPAVLLAVLAGSGLAAISAIESTGIENQLKDLQQQGRLVYTLTSQDPSKPVEIDRASCEALADQPGVDRAGLVKGIGFYDVPQIGTGMIISAASSSLFPELTTHGALVGSALRESGPAFNLKLPDGYVAQAMVLPAQPSGIDTNSMVLVPLRADQQTGDSCRVVFERHGNPKEAGDRALASLQAHGSEPLVANTPHQENIDPVAAYLKRASRFLPLLIGILGGFAAAVINRVRLSEFAAYRLSGTSGRSLALLMWTEQALLAGTLASATAVATLVLRNYPISPDTVIYGGLTAGLAWIATATLFTIDIAWRRPTDLAKDR